MDPAFLPLLRGEINKTTSNAKVISHLRILFKAVLVPTYSTLCEHVSRFGKHHYIHVDKFAENKQ